MTITVVKCGGLIDGTGAVRPEGAAIRIVDGKIASIAAADHPADGADTVIDASEYWVLPGLIDAHIHLAMFNNLTFNNYRVAQWTVSPELQQMYALFHAQLCFEMGFTTMREMGLNSTQGLLTRVMCAVRDSINLGLFAGPRILVGSWAVMTGAHLDRLLPRNVQREGLQSGDGPYELRRIVRSHIRDGVDFIKTCASGGFQSEGLESDTRNLTQEELDAVVDEAHAQHVPVAVHCFTPSSQRMTLQAGADTIEHCVYTDEKAIEAIVERGVYVTPTLAHRSDRSIEIRKHMGTPQSVLDGFKELQPHCHRTFQQMLEAGVKLAMGTDMGYDPNMGDNALELELYVQLGMSPMEAILTATRNAATAIGWGDRLGTLEPGKLADLIVVDGNPLEDIRYLQERERMKIIMKEGQVYVDRRPGQDKEVLPLGYGQWRKFDT